MNPLPIYLLAYSVIGFFWVHGMGALALKSGRSATSSVLRTIAGILTIGFYLSPGLWLAFMTNYLTARPICVRDKAVELKPFERRIEAFCDMMDSPWKKSSA